LTIIALLHVVLAIICFLAVKYLLLFVCIAYRILLTILVTVASAERTFSKLKLIKSYLRPTTSQERLSGLAILSIERNMRKLIIKV
jgi:hypothetical protein